jgi:hypothetical protein
MRTTASDAHAGQEPGIFSRLLRSKLGNALLAANVVIFLLLNGAYFPPHSPVDELDLCYQTLTLWQVLVTAFYRILTLPAWMATEMLHGVVIDLLVPHALRSYGLERALFVVTSSAQGLVAGYLLERYRARRGVERDRALSVVPDIPTVAAAPRRALVTAASPTPRSAGVF